MQFSLGPKQLWRHEVKVQDATRPQIDLEATWRGRGVSVEGLKPLVTRVGVLVEPKYIYSRRNWLYIYFGSTVVIEICSIHDMRYCAWEYLVTTPLSSRRVLGLGVFALV